MTAKTIGIEFLSGAGKCMQSFLSVVSVVSCESST